MTNQTLRVGFIGDRLPEYSRPQQAAEEVLGRAAAELGVRAEVSWTQTPALERWSEVESVLGRADALWCSPGSPYLSLGGALNGIRFARERGRPFVGTCAGFQHAVLEYARNVLGIADAAHEEYEPDARTLLLTALVCPVASKTLKIKLLPGSRARAAYGRAEVEEYYYRNFGLNPAFRREVEEGGLRVSGEDEAGEPRVLEIPDHPFFVATLFVPGASYFEGVVKAEGAHPLVKALLRAGLSFRAGQSLEAAGGRS